MAMALLRRARGHPLAQNMQLRISEQGPTVTAITPGEVRRILFAYWCDLPSVALRYDGFGTRSGVALGAEEVERDVLFLSDHPAIVAGGNTEEVASGHRDLGAVVHADRSLAGGDQPDMLHLARRRADQRGDMLGPAPTGGIDGTAHLLTVEVEQLKSPQGKRANVLGFCHCDHLQRKGHDPMVAKQLRPVLDRIAVPSAPDASHGDRATYFRPAALPGVEALHASFVTHRYPPHLHQSWTVASVDEGAATFELERSRHVAPAGTTFLIPPGSVHTGEPASADGYRYRVLYLDPADCWDETDGSHPMRYDRNVPVVLDHQELAGRLARLHAALPAQPSRLNRVRCSAQRPPCSRTSSPAKGHRHAPLHTGACPRPSTTSTLTLSRTSPFMI